MQRFGIHLPAEQLDLIEHECDLRYPYETGGLLMGWSDGSAALITHVVGPGPDAIHRRYSFTPDHVWQAGEVARIYDGSGRTSTYLGDWHSHPGGRAVPSVRDWCAAVTIGRSRAARCATPLMLIVSTGPSGIIDAAGYRLQRRRLRECVIVAAP